MARKNNLGTRPDYFAPIRHVAPKQVSEQAENENEQHLAALSRQNGWAILKEYIEQEIANLENINKAAIEAGATFEDIGRNAVLVQLCKEELLRVIQKVEDARESTDGGN